jgi:predicted nicotinamide N-methyase
LKIAVVKYIQFQELIIALIDSIHSFISRTLNLLMDENEQLPLSDLQDRVSSQTFKWLKTSDEEEARIKAELEDDEAANATALFGQLFNQNKEKDDGYDDDDESVYNRVEEWCSSLINPDGIGGTNVYDDDDAVTKHDKEEEGSASEGALKVKYILSESSGGHGDDLWAAARHVANMFADPIKCKELLKPLLLGRKFKNEDDDNNDNNDNSDNPLLGVSFVELGAGAGVPSWTAMKCGAIVVCTDQAISNRIRCIAESAQRNLQDMKTEASIESDDNDNDNKNNTNNQQAITYAEMVRACPYDWGNSIDEVVEILNENRNIVQKSNRRFDVVLAADCIYMPHFHSLLLDSIKMLLSERGVALLPFALHGNTKDDNIWSIVDLAKEKGFDVEVLESQQLTPQGAFMDSKRALVNMLRLTLRMI